MKNNPITGALYLFKGIGLISQPGLRRFVAVPLALNVILFAGLIWLGGHYFDGIMDELLPSGWDVMRWLLWPIFALTIAFLGFYTFTLLANLIAAPFNGMLAEAVERHLTGQTLEGAGGLKGIAKDVGIAVRSELRKLGYILPRMIPLLILFIIPGVQIVAPFIWLLFSTWMLAISYVDFPMGNHGLGFPEQRARLGKRRFAAIGFGGAVLVGISIPIINFIAIPAAVAGATAMWVDQLRDDTN
ncbi:MAG: sulfate transporter CysZ [Chromatiales bacterium]|nr:sulfate transporter CysZ [Chromatiales bacterium]